MAFFTNFVLLLLLACAITHHSYVQSIVLEPCSRLIVQNNEAIDPLRWSVDGAASTGDVVCRLFSTTVTAVVRGQSPAQYVSLKSGGEWWQPVSNSVCPQRCEVQICETNVVKQPSHRSHRSFCFIPISRKGQHLINDLINATINLSYATLVFSSSNALSHERLVNYWLSNLMLASLVCRLRTFLVLVWSLVWLLMLHLHKANIGRWSLEWFIIIHIHISTQYHL